MASGNSKIPGADESDGSPRAMQWFCAYTKPQQEKYAQFHLNRQAIETFLPKLKFRRPAGTAIRWQIGPLFPRYLFIRSAAKEQLGKVHSTRGIIKLIAFGGKPAIVPDEVIEIIRSRCHDDIIEPQNPEFRKGDSVKIIAGPYAGMNALFDQVTPQQERVVILLAIMATVAKVEISRDLLMHSMETD